MTCETVTCIACGPEEEIRALAEVKRDEHLESAACWCNPAAYCVECMVPLPCPLGHERSAWAHR